MSLELFRHIKIKWLKLVKKIINELKLNFVK